MQTASQASLQKINNPELQARAGPILTGMVNYLLKSRPADPVSSEDPPRHGVHGSISV